MHRHIFTENSSFQTQFEELNMFTQNTSPLDQFEIRNILSLDAAILGNAQISLTNIGLYLTIGVFLILSLNLLATNYKKIVSNI